MIIDISRDITACPVYPGDPGCEVTGVQSLKNGDGCNLSKIDTGLHNGTHADAPLHFIDGGVSIDNVSPDHFIGECVVCETAGGAIDEERAKDLPVAERLLIKSGGKAYFTGDGAAYLAGNGVKLIGTDSNSVGIHGDQVAPHRAFLSVGVDIVENLELSEVRPGRYFLSALPIKIGGAEAAPVRAVLVDNDI
ncbi:MAG: cyclase family protein [Clostridia bacterium]|nr:cyclase family protein [Clostridia bacterium]